MPSKTFLHLPETKQKNILYAGVLEFIEQPYEAASVVRICQQASIPRTTFYSYFGGLSDIFTHIYYLVAKQCMQAPEMSSACAAEGPDISWLSATELEDYFVNLTNSSKGMTLLYESIDQAPAEDRIFNHAVLSLMKQYQMKGISRQQLEQEVASMSASLKPNNQ